MIRKSWSSGVLALACLFVGVLATVAQAQTFNISPGGFSASNVCANSNNPAATCQVLTNGFPSQPKVTASGALRLTSAKTDQHASAWFVTRQPLSTGFTTAFEFQISGGGSAPADGLAFVIQGDPAGTGAIGFVFNGQNIAYGNGDQTFLNGPGWSILNSLAIELDTHQNTDYSDPDGNHIAIQSCGPNNSSTLSSNSADHNYQCPSGQLAKIALQSLPAGLSLSDGNVHTITVNYMPLGNCTQNCNNLSVFFDSVLIVQATIDLTQQLLLTTTPSNNNQAATGAFIGFTAATGALVQNNDILSWSFSQLPLSPITIPQPLQPTQTEFNYSPTLTAGVDYSQSGLPTSTFTGVVMQGTSQAITDAQFTTLTNNTPFQGTTCLHQDLGQGTFSCVVTTDLCTTPANNVPAGANCPNTGTQALIGTTNSFNADVSQKPYVAPGYIMGKDTALSCLFSDDNTCKGLKSIFQSISGDPTLVGRTKEFNSILVPIEGVVGPNTQASTNPALNNGWTNGAVTVTLTSNDQVPSNNSNPPSPLPTVQSITYTITGANAPTPINGAITGNTGSFSVPGTVEGVTTVTFQGTDSADTVETITTNANGQVSTSLPTLTIKVDLTPPTFNCVPPAVAWQPADVSVPCTASDNAGGSGLATPSAFNVMTAVPVGTETNAAMTVPANVADIAGNTVSTGSFGPFEVDKKAPVISGLAVVPANPTFQVPANITFTCSDGGSGVVLCGAQNSSTFPPTATTTITVAADVASAGSKTFTVYSQDAVGNQSTPAVLSYSVSRANPVLTWTTPAPITFGTALSATQLNASANVNGGFAYVPPAGTVLGAGTQTLTANFTPADTNDYTLASTSVQIVVNKATPVITWANPAPITFGTPLGAAQLNATANVPGTFVYNPPAGTVLTAGPQTLSVTFTPTDAADYTSASAQVSLTVIKATPVITWANPAPIPFGTPLSGTQLNATANVPGTFVYSPPAGTILNPGNQVLSVAFTPTDTADYNGASAQVTILVTQPQISFAPPAFNFGTVVAGSTTSVTVMVSNPGTAPLVISKIVVTGNEDRDLFHIVNGCTSPVAPGGSCPVTIRFYAGEVESLVESVVFTDNAPAGSQAIPATVTVVRRH